MISRIQLTCLIALVAIQPYAAGISAAEGAEADNSATLRKENFDKDPGWDGHNNRLARELPPETVQQDFGYSVSARNTGTGSGEIGGRIQPAADPAFYAKKLPPKSFADPLSASGTLYVGKGGGNSLLGFFNWRTVNEWRAPNAIVIRINSRGEAFQAHVEYASSRWRAGAGIIGTYDPATDRNSAKELPCGVAHKWSLDYDPNGEGGKGTITLKIGDDKAVSILDSGHRADGATFNRFGFLNVVKSFDGANEIWIGDLTLNGERQDLTSDPGWEGIRNRMSYKTSGVRPRFDFGYSATRYAGGKVAGELGGMFYRGDCRYPQKLGCYGDRIGPLNLEKPLHAAGTVVMRRGVSDSTTSLGFYHSTKSMTVNESQQFGAPRDYLGIQIEGPSREGFYFYPGYRNDGGGVSPGYPVNPPHILPDGAVHHWTLDYDPAAAEGRGRIIATLDGARASIDFNPGDKAAGATFDRFGLVTPWIDGNGQEVYFDDLEYTCR